MVVRKQRGELWSVTDFVPASISTIFWTEGKPDGLFREVRERERERKEKERKEEKTGAMQLPLRTDSCGCQSALPAFLSLPLLS
jgi:hypothetical protein